VVARVIERADTATLNGFIREALPEKVSLIATDDHPGYRNSKKHGIVRHSAGQYVNGAVHTQTIDGFWSLLKRGIMGNFHKVSRKYLPLYVAEFRISGVFVALSHYRVLLASTVFPKRARLRDSNTLASPRHDRKRPLLAQCDNAVLPPLPRETAAGAPTGSSLGVRSGPGVSPVPHPVAKYRRPALFGTIRIVLPQPIWESC
ncbi:MAG: IS1595 family transposase, partial [Methylocella sp.]